jgi:hypothetical protein
MDNIYCEDFIKTLSEELVCHYSYCSKDDVSGTDWEKIFSTCINADWERSLKFYDLVDHKTSIAWSAKTLKYNSKRDLKKVELISSRIVTNCKSNDPIQVGKSILEIWNERVNEVKNQFNGFYTVVLLRSFSLNEFKVFQFETECYDYNKFNWIWSDRSTLQAYDNLNQKRFTWQPSGTQFKINKQIPANHLTLNLRLPEKMTREKILSILNFNEDMYGYKYG